MRNLKQVLSCLAAALLLQTACAKAATPEPNADGAELFQQSYDREAGGKLQDALSALDRLSGPRKESYLASLRRGWLLYRLGRYAESVDAYQHAIAAAPQSIEARVGLLLPQQALKHWSDAEATAKAVLAIDPQSYLANLRLAFTLYNLGRFTEAATLYGQLKEHYPSDPEPRSGLGWSLLKQARTAEAAREFRDLLAIQPKHALGKQGLDATGANR